MAIDPQVRVVLGGRAVPGARTGGVASFDLDAEPGVVGRPLRRG